MPWGGYGSDGVVQALENRITALERRLTATNAVAFGARRRRFRLGSANLLAIISAGGTVTVTVTFTSPMDTMDYQVDVTVPALAGAPVTNVTVPEADKTLTGCKVQFVTPSALSLGATVIVLALSGPS